MANPQTLSIPENSAKNPQARAFCAVKSEYTGGSFELGDTYLDDIQGTCTQGPNILLESGRNREQLAVGDRVDVETTDGVLNIEFYGIVVGFKEGGIDEGCLVQVKDYEDDVFDVPIDDIVKPGIFVKSD